MKKRSIGCSASTRCRCCRYPPTMLALWARYQASGDGRRRKVTQCRTPVVLGTSGSPSHISTASAASRSSDSFTDRHHGLPGAGAVGGESTPRRSCQRMKAISARRYGRMLRPADLLVVERARQAKPLRGMVADRGDRERRACCGARRRRPGWSGVSVSHGFPGCRMTRCVAGHAIRDDAGRDVG